MKYQWFTDAGHGWLQVPVKELEELIIEKDISVFSYISKDGQWAYLEEDCDASIFINAKGRDNVEFAEHEEYSEHSFIRDLPYFELAK